MEEEGGSSTREHAIEVIFFFAGLGFVLGSFCFWPGIMEVVGTVWLPDKDSYVHLGCKFFVACSVVYVVMFVYLGVEMVNMRKESSRVLLMPRRANHPTWLKLQQFKDRSKQFKVLCSEDALRKNYQDIGEDPTLATMEEYTWEQHGKVALRERLISRCDAMSNAHVSAMVWRNNLLVKDAKGTEFSFYDLPQDFCEEQFPVYWRFVHSISASMREKLGWDAEVESITVDAFNKTLDIIKGALVHISDIHKDSYTVDCDIRKHAIEKSKLIELEETLEKLNLKRYDATEVPIDNHHSEELASLKLFALCKRARDCGASDEEIENACDSNAQRDKLINLIVSRESAQDGSKHSSILQITGVPVNCLVDPGQAVTRRQIFEAILYVVGSIVFAAGTILWDPRPQVYGIRDGEFGVDQSTYFTRYQWLAIADGLFMLGSFIFAFAAFINATYIYAMYPKELPLTEDLRPPTGSLRTISLAISSCTVFGGFSFIAGTMGFIPRQYMDCVQGSMEGMEKIGCLFYIVGSILYTLAAALSFCRLRAKDQLEKEYAERTNMMKAFLLRQALKRRRLKEEILELRDNEDSFISCSWFSWGKASQAREAIGLLEPLNARVSQ